MTSTAVKTLQTKLGSLPTTGYYGSLTAARVTAYQKFVGLPQTGVADPVTQARLWVRGWSGTAAAGTTTYPTLRLGMTSTAVKTLQTRLGSLPTTGYYGTLTQSRVSAYQRFAGLPVTGVADSRTQQVLYTRGWSSVAPAAFTRCPDPEGARDDRLAASAARHRSAPASPASRSTRHTPPSRTSRWRLGSRGAAVRALQHGLGGLAVDGVFGSVTRDKVAALQRSMALPATGVVTAEVWDVLEARDFPFATSRSTVLREGDAGPQVVAVQRLLGVRVTGVFDRVTRDAVKAAQAGAGLASTGVRRLAHVVALRPTVRLGRDAGAERAADGTGRHTAGQARASTVTDSEARRSTSRGLAPRPITTEPSAAHADRHCRSTCSVVPRSATRGESPQAGSATTRSPYAVSPASVASATSRARGRPSGRRGRRGSTAHVPRRPRPGPQRPAGGPGRGRRGSTRTVSPPCAAARSGESVTSTSAPVTASPSTTVAPTDHVASAQ